MKSAKHYRVVGIVKDLLVDFFICDGSSKTDASCRKNGYCEHIVFFRGMSDFAAYRLGAAERFTLLSVRGEFSKASNTFKESPVGSAVLSLSTREEYLELFLNDVSIPGVELPGFSAVKLFPLTVDTRAYAREYGREDAAENPGSALWGFAGEGDVIRGGDPLFTQLMRLKNDYTAASSAELVELKRAALS